MFCGLPIRVEADPALLAAARPNRNGRASSLRAARPARQQRRHGEHHDVVDQERRQHAADGDGQGQQPQRLPRLARDPRRRRVIEAGGADPRRQDHEAGEQQQGREMDRRGDLPARNRPGGDQHHRDDHRDAGAVDPRARKCAPAPFRHRSARTKPAEGASSVTVSERILHLYLGLGYLSADHRVGRLLLDPPCKELDNRDGKFDFGTAA